MKLCVFGASGGVGRCLVQQAEARGHDVTTVTRQALPVDGVHNVVADVLDPQTFDVVRGHDVVLSCLGLKRQHPANPWSALVSPTDFCSRTARFAVDAMKRHAVPRVIAVSAAGVGDSAVHLNAVMRFLVATSKIGIAYRDLALMEDVYANSGLGFLCPRPTRLTDGPKTERVVETQAFGMNAAISRADVAWWMLMRAEDEAAGEQRRVGRVQITAS